ncbi:Regulator of G protein signaling superfamily [Penicillium cf. griseofulvum]|uniref:Regulator of G protein signaling superfamily n=1 Tax=Penicillium cf. griseofulvum TaxID=2972120 RepID=A0A9W9IVH5_9EURO|nr:Regulator of G protein signaling superfamily [Penicillium cf. griseofulvum]KAJ5435777.1 Regulator of G protein signaling superfamily [Penicillium cf. griseofulvum]
MLKKKTLAPSLFFRNHTPTATPELSPTSSDSDSEEDMESSGSRPVSLAISSGAFSMRPTLDEVLANIAPPPYTLSAFMAYLSQNHCLETLEFTMEANRYRDSYYALAERLGHDTMESDCPETQHLRMLWKRLLTAYIFPGSPREINLSSEVRDALLQYKDMSAPPCLRR